MSDQPTLEYLLYPAADLRAFGARCFEAAGMRPNDAETASRLLVRSDLRGVETHGLAFMPNYCRAMRSVRINPVPDITIAADMGASLMVDGDGGLGHVVTSRAMTWCIDRAQEYGIGMAAVRNSRHNGAASLYALQAMEAGMLGLSLTGGGVRVAPAGGREAMLGTNPIAFAAPTLEEPPFVMDMATSVVAGAKVHLYAEKGLPLPSGWALDPEGNPTTDAAAGDKGALLPLGGTLEMSSYKGTGLGLMVETLCHVLAGMAAGPERARGAKSGMGHFVAAVCIDRFRPPGDFRRQMDANLRLLRESAPMAGVERIYTPGEIEWLREGERTANGVPLLRKTVDALRELAGELGVPSL